MFKTHPKGLKQIKGGKYPLPPVATKLACRPIIFYNPTGQKGRNNRGIPDELMKRNNHAMRIATQMLPQTNNAVQQFESHGGNLTTFQEFGHDPLHDRDQFIQQREATFHEHYADFEQFFYATVNGNNNVFRQGLLHFIEISKQLLSQM